MLEKIQQLDIDLFLYLNGKHTPFWDEIMITFSEKLTWVPFYALILAFLIWKYKWDSWKIILAILITFVVTENIASSVFKPLVERLRPCHSPMLEGLVHTPDGCGGKFGFFSAHAANTFGFTTFIAYILNGKWKFVGLLLIIWASVVSYSRVYLGVHYPLDILFGAICGTSISFGFYKFLVKSKWVKSIL